MSAKTTIIMPAFNVGSYIGEAVNSVLAQTRGDWRLVIVDDGSVDETVEIARSFSDDRITVIEQENAGAGAARNRAAAEANTEYLSMLDADDAWAPDYLEKMLGALEASPDLAFVACDALAFIDDRNDAVLCSENVRMIPPVTLERVASRAFQVYTAVSMRRDWFERVGNVVQVDDRNIVQTGHLVQVVIPRHQLALQVFGQQHQLHVNRLTGHFRRLAVMNLEVDGVVRPQPV